MQGLSTVGENWLIYEGEGNDRPIFSVAKHVSIRRSKWLAHVTPCGGGSSRKQQGYAVEGSYLHRCCTVYDGLQRPVAEVRRKEAAPGVSLGGDVFRLVVQSGLHVSLAMAIVVLLDQMFG